jgi:hypothetical protein
VKGILLLKAILIEAMATQRGPKGKKFGKKIARSYPRVDRDRTQNRIPILPGTLPDRSTGAAIGSAC